MTLPYSVSRARYLGNGTATVFPFSFKVWKTSQLEVTLTAPDGSSQQARGWTAQLSAEGGSVTYLHNGAPLPEGWQLAIVRNMPFTQDIDLVSATRFDPGVMEDGLDQAAAERQQLLEQLSRAVILPPTSEQRPEDMAQELLQARDDAVSSAGSAAGSATSAADSAARAESSEQAAAASADAAARSQEDAAASADAAARSATAAGQSAEAAAESESRAAGSAASILALQIQVTTLSPGLPASADYDPATGILHLGLPKGDSGAAAIATPTSLGSVMPQTGDDDGLELGADGTLRIRQASATQRGSVLASTTAQAGAVPMAGADGSLDESWVPKPDAWDSFPPFVPVPVWGVTFGGSDGRRAILPGESAAREEWVKCDGGSDGRGGTVPDMTGRYVRGASDTEAEGTKGGSETFSATLSGTTGATTLTTAQMPSHYHRLLNKTGGIGSANIAQQGGGGGIGEWGGKTEATGSGQSHTHPLSGTAEGTNLDPYIAMHFIMKVV